MGRNFWWLLARNFGLPQNADAFEAVAKSLPITILAKHKNQLIQTEALLLGQAGLLNEDFEEHYPKMLKKEYLFLQKKYQLPAIHFPVNFLRMRPANFPTVRLAQLAALIHSSVHLFSKIKETTSLNEIIKLLQCTANDYWNYHYRFEKETTVKPKSPGKQMTGILLLNTVIPVLYTYGLLNKKEEYKTRAILFAESIAPEKNSITANFGHLGITCLNAYDSQALIYWKKNYCTEKRCLQCSIGNKILKPEKVNPNDKPLPTQYQDEGFLQPGNYRQFAVILFGYAQQCCPVNKDKLLFCQFFLGWPACVW